MLSAKIAKNLQWYTLLLLVFGPKIVMNAIPGLSSAMRVDILIAFIYIVIVFFKFLMKKKILYRKNFLLSIILLLFLIFYVINSKNFTIAAGQAFLYISIMGAFIHGATISEHEISKKIKFLYCALFINMLIHALFYLSQINSYSGTYVGDSGFDEDYYIFGLYGISSMPFQFSIYVAAFILISIHGNLKRNKYWLMGVLFSIFALLTGDSRISLFALVFSIFGFRTILVAPLLYILSQFFQTKSISTLSNLGGLSLDPSLAMRLFNIENYVSWLSLKTLFFGGGAQSFLEFSSAYGLPGPLDMAYVRIVAEFGILGSLLIFSILFGYIKNRFVIKNIGLGVALIFCGVYSIVNEGLLSSKSGHLMMFVIGLLYFKPREFRKISYRANNSNA